MDTIAIFNQKGGVGKTTSVVNFAACLEKEFSKKVLVVDCDSQCNASSYLLTFTDGEEYEVQRSEQTVEDYINGTTSLSELLNHVIVPYRRKMIETDIYVVRGTKNMDIIEIEDDVFKGLIKEAEDLGFDYVIFDCPANLTQPTMATLSAIQFILIPVTADIYCLSGYDMLIDNVQYIRSTTNINLQILGIFFNNMKSSRRLDKYMYADNLENMNDMMFKTKIRDTADIPTAGYMGVPMPYYKASASVNEDYIKLMKEIKRKINKIKKGA